LSSVRTKKPRPSASAEREGRSSDWAMEGKGRGVKRPKGESIQPAGRAPRRLIATSQAVKPLPRGFPAFDQGNAQVLRKKKERLPSELTGEEIEGGTYQECLLADPRGPRMPTPGLGERLQSQGMRPVLRKLESAQQTGKTNFDATREKKRKHRICSKKEEP